MIAQMTLRQIPDRVAKQLRAKSQTSGLSLNRTAIQLLEEALGLQVQGGRKRDLSMIAGSWSETDFHEFEKSTQIFEEIDAEMWRS